MRLNLPRTLPRIPLGIFLLAVTVRLVYVMQDGTSPFFDYFLLDAQAYADQARAFVAGTWPGTRPFFRPPLYPMFVGSLFAAFGDSTLVVKLAQAVLGSLTCVLVYAISRLLHFGTKQSAVASLICCFCGPMIFFDAQPLSACLDVFTSLCALTALLMARNRSDLWSWALAGVLVAVAGQVRGSALTWIPLCLIAATLAGRRAATTQGKSPAWAGTWRPLVGFGAAVGIFLAPVALHNARYDRLPTLGAPSPAPRSDQSLGSGLLRLASGNSSLVGYAGGINLYLGNTPSMQRVNYVASYDHFTVYDDLVQEVLATGVTTAHGVNHFFVERTKRGVVADPGAWLDLMAFKTWQLGRGEEIPRGTLLYAHRSYSSLLSLLLWKKWIAFPSGVLIPLALFGIFSLRQSWKEHWLVWGVMLAHAGFVVLFFVTARYRLFLLPVAAIYAAHGGMRLAHGIQTRQWFVHAAAFAALLLFSNYGSTRMSEQHGAFEYFNLANALQRDKRLDLAEMQYRNLLRVDPAHSSGHYNLGYLLLRQRRFDEARDAFLRTIALKETHAQAHGNLGNAELSLGNARAAATAYRRALALAPNLTWAEAGLATAEKRLRPQDDHGEVP